MTARNLLLAMSACTPVNVKSAGSYIRSALAKLAKTWQHHSLPKRAAIFQGQRTDAELAARVEALELLETALDLGGGRCLARHPGVRKQLRRGGPVVRVLRAGQARALALE
jgi:hypothetical protein